MQREWCVIYELVRILRLNDFMQGLNLRGIKLVIQWRYMKSLCSLVQRIGRGVRDPTLDGVGVYFIEPKYLDRKKSKKRKRGEKDDTGNTTMLNAIGDDHDQDVSPQNESQNDSPCPIQAAPGRHIPCGSTQNDYLENAMDTYINANTRGICQRAVIDEYFGNPRHEFIAIYV